MHAEDELAARDVLQLLDELAIAVAARDPLILGERERVRPRRPDAQPKRRDGCGDALADLGELAQRVIGRAADAGRDLDRALGQLGMDAIGERPAVEPREHRVDLGAQLVVAVGDEHQLLLDADRERRPLAEVLVEHARARGGRHGLAPGAGRRSHGRLFGHGAFVPHPAEANLPLPVAELLEPIVGDPEAVGNLVQDGDRGRSRARAGRGRC
jgi:hypothetical protein